MNKDIIAPVYEPSRAFHPPVPAPFEFGVHALTIEEIMGTESTRTIVQQYAPWAARMAQSESLAPFVSTFTIADAAAFVPVDLSQSINAVDAALQALPRSEWPRDANAPAARHRSQWQPSEPVIPAGGFGPTTPGALQILGPGRNQSFDRGWRFLRGAGDGFEIPETDDTSWYLRDLPHDWSIEDLPSESGSERIGPFDPNAPGGGATAFTIGGEGWYRKHFVLEQQTASSQVHILFGGVQTESDVWLNGRHLGRHVHGYTPFGYDLTPYLRQGENILALRVRNFGRNSRWYAGAGLYRGVTLDVITGHTHIQRWGISVVTRRLTTDAAELEIESRIETPEPGVVLVSRIRNPSGAIVAAHEVPASPAVGQSISLPSPALWSPESPLLYTLETELRRGADIIDSVSTTFGVRIVTLDAQAGLRINGVPVKLRGGCIHHDNGLLGAAAYPDADERRVRLLKARGFNALRGGHAPSSRAVADACDKHGMLLIEEAFDMWHSSKTQNDYSLDFAAHWERDLSAMVLAARNHPSIIMWSIGNEVPHRATVEGVRTAWDLANTVHRLDPSRPVTAGINGYGGRPLIADADTARAGFAGEPDESAAIFLDAVGYNYKLDRYELDHDIYPQRVIYGSESFPRDVFRLWDTVERLPYVIGDFVWAAMDYLGEAGLGRVSRAAAEAGMPGIPTWPWIIANLGDLDITGRQRPQSFPRDVVWHISPIEMAVVRPLPEGMVEYLTPWAWPDEQQSWTWPGAEGEPLTMRIYTLADRVELRVNDALVACTEISPGTRLPVECQVTYTPGDIEAIAYQNGSEVGRRKFTTVDVPDSIRITPERNINLAGKNRLSYFWVELVDANGRVVPDATKKIRLSVTGPATLAGFGSANPLARGSYQTNEAETYDGRALAILKSAGTSGSVHIMAESQNLRPCNTSISFV